jgi:hypothetical protein
LSYRRLTAEAQGPGTPSKARYLSAIHKTVTKTVSKTATKTISKTISKTATKTIILERWILPDDRDHYHKTIRLDHKIGPYDQTIRSDHKIRP